MTEILGHDDGPLPQAPDDAGPVDVEPIDGEPMDADPIDWGARLGAFTALAEPATLAVTAVVCDLAALMVGPSYRFAAYPFNQGITSLRSVFSPNSPSLHPLRSYLTSVAPATLLVVVGLTAAVLSLVRVRAPQPAWVRAIGAAAMIVGVVLGLLVAAGAWQSSTYDVQVLPTATTS